MLITMKALKSPSGFLGVYLVQKRESKPKIFSVKLKSIFSKRISRVLCSSCPARMHLLSLDDTRKILDRLTLINLGQASTLKWQFSGGYPFERGFRAIFIKC